MRLTWKSISVNTESNCWKANKYKLKWIIFFIIIKYTSVISHLSPDFSYASILFADSEYRNVIKRIVWTKFPAHYTFLFELNEYFKNYREDEYAEERSSSESEMQKESRKIRNRLLNAFKNFSKSGAELYIANYDSKSKIMRLLDSDFISKL